ncbi:MAG: bifunctional homocysteine S-methyltransferase/methylenetetrahydrofolate reductase [Clostridiales bacterium]|nr:bifunctional homocysteine S-methyltransferase/methylenetetrahydrofolate reductase [Clostridiales bacterium]
MTDIRTDLKENRPLLFDGAMGTCFAALPGRAEERCELANLLHPEEIASIHRAYLEAGCRAIKTNTFTVGVDLAQGREELAGQLIQAGGRLALEAADGRDAYVFADIGPAPEGGKLSRGENYCRQADLFLARGVTHFLAETLPSDEGIGELARHLKARCPEAFLIVSFAVAFDGTTCEGFSGRTLLRRTAALPEVDAVGFNCVSSPHHMLEYIRTLDLSGITLSVMPNAGYPSVLGRRTVFQGTPDYFGQKLAQIAQAGAAIVGGCCGTTPEHLARAAALVGRPPVTLHAQAAKELPRKPKPHVNTLAEKLDSGKRVVAVELDPPVDDDISFFLDGVRDLRDAGADAVTLADCPIGRPRADSSLLACKIKRELGVEPLPHMTCRDRNLNATKALLLGLSIEGVHNVLLVTGDPIPSQDRDEVKSVFNFNSRKLARYVSGLNETVLQTPFRIFGALNLNVRNFEIQLKLAQEKEANGVTGFLTQPVLSREALENLKLARQTLKGKLLGGVFPMVSHKNAVFLNNEVPGMRVCDEITALYEGKDRDAAEDLAVTISARIAREIAPYTDGVYLMTPFKRVALMTRIIREL